MTSIVTTPRAPLGTYENPRPFKKGEKRILNDIYFDSKGRKKAWRSYGFGIPDTLKKGWTYDRVIELLKNTGFIMVWTEKEFIDSKQHNKNARGELFSLIKHSCGCCKLRKLNSLKNSIKKNHYSCGSNGICLKLNGQTFNEDKTKKYCTRCKCMLLLNDFYMFPSGRFNSSCYTCVRNRQKEYREKNINNRLDIILYGCQTNNTVRNNRGREHEFNIDLEYLLELWEKCNGICFRFKKKMSILDGDVWLVSVDRIDPSRGYIKGNVQLVSWTYNLMKGDKTEEDMDEVFAQFKIAVNN
jgi:hypothetical protein